MDFLKINKDRLEKNMMELAKIGYNPEDRGIYRPSFSPADHQARQWLIEKMKSAGMETRVDGAANVIGRYGGGDDQAKLLIGSHIDSVPCGGMFDGTLGVLAGLECVQTLQEAGIQSKTPLEVIATSDEEGRFGGMLGAQALTGNLNREWLETAQDISGEKLTDAMKNFGLNPDKALSAAYDPADILAYLELHIEQGPVLETENKTIGIVDGISGVFKWLIKLIGKADHAGTAPMHLRSDAFMGLADFAHEIPRIIEEDGTDKSRLTIGYVDLKPGFAHTVPGQVIFSLVGRDLDHSVMKELANSSRKVLSNIARKYRLMFEYEEKSWLKPRMCTDSVKDIITETVKNLEYSYINMPSGAGHDAQFFTDICPTGLIFVPSEKGISHAPDEWTNWNDIEKGSNVLLNVTRYLLK